MKVLFIVYHDLKTEARSAEILECMKMYGPTTLVSYCRAHDDPDVTMITNRSEKKGYFEFLRNARKAIRDIKPDLIMLHDNFTALLIPYIGGKSVVLYDSSELILLTEKCTNKRIKAKIARIHLLFEKKYLDRANVVIAANEERAEIMKAYYPLKEIPIVFDNMHKIETSYDLAECEQQYGHLFRNNKFTVLYAGGIAEQRMTYPMVEQIGLLGPEFQFIIVGQATPQALDRYNKLLEAKGISNTHYLGFITREQLKYLMEKSSVTVSAFAMDTLNNINCASGKAYEGLFSGKPLLAGINPPLMHLCERYGVGVSTTDYGKGCIELRENYATYVENVRKYIADLHYEDRVRNLKAAIDERLSVQGIHLPD